MLQFSAQQIALMIQGKIEGDATVLVNQFGKIEEAKKAGMVTVGMTGETGGKMNGLCDYMLKSPSKDTPRIQETHILMGHIICQLIEEGLYPVK